MVKDYSGDAGSYRLYWFDENSESGVGRVVRLVSRTEGDELVKHNEAQLGVEWDGETPCYRTLTAEPKQYMRRVRSRYVPVDEESLSLASSTAFSQSHLLALAGTKFKHGRSRTARMSEDQKAARVKKIFEDGLVRKGGVPVLGIRVAHEDVVEQATDKKRAWAELGSLLQDVVVVRESACL